MQSYDEFLQKKQFYIPPDGFDVSLDQIHQRLFPFQKAIVRWGLIRGRAAFFGGTGLGKTIKQLEWSRHIHLQTMQPVLILAPLAVATQTVREGKMIDLEVKYCRDQSDVVNGINITNYDRLHLFDPSVFAGVVLDESSILKSFTGKLRNEIIESFANTPYKLACTATPAPNDYMELGNHSEFLGVMSRTEMLSMFFVHDGGETQKWRLKGHAADKFWQWVASWSVMYRKPSDLGYEDGDYILPPLHIHDHIVELEREEEGYLFAVEAQTLQERQQARRESIELRVAECAKIVNASDKPFLVWCDLNAESSALASAIPGAVEVKGSDTPEHKEKAMLDFADGKIRVLITKPKIAGFGMNWQHCWQTAFVGISDSFEQIYQAIRRFYRFGQKHPVHVHMIVSDAEGAIADNIKRKEADFERMAEELAKYTKNIIQFNLQATLRVKTDYVAQQEMIIPTWLRSEMA